MSRGHPLDPVLRPRSIAVIGASADPRKRGHRVLGALRSAGYEGSVYPVNPKGGRIEGLEVYGSVDALPEAVDLALVCTPAETVPDAIEACGRRGVRAAVVLAVGFAESGEEGRTLETKLLETARTHGMRVVGPNTSGILNLPFGLNLIGAPGLQQGSISLLVQSGNLALQLMNELAARTGEGIALCVGVGNQLDVGFHEYLDFLGADPGTRAVVVHAEAFKDTRAFLRVAARVAREKPVLLLRGARSRRGRQAARSHTGALAGEHGLLEVGLRQCGVVSVARSDEILHLAETLATQPPVRDGAGIAILSDGGGQGTLAADLLSELGVPLADPSPDTQARLRALLGRPAAVANPVDVAGATDADPGIFAGALDVLADDEAVGGVLVVGLFGGYGVRFHPDLAAAEASSATHMAERMRSASKPLVVHSMYAPRRTSPLRLLSAARVPVIESLEVACRAIGETWLRGRALARPGWMPVAEEDGAGGSDAAEHDIVGKARGQGRSMLTEPEARALMSAAGVRFPPSVVCASADAAVRAAVDLPAGAVLKAVSPGLVHKTEAGAVALDVRGADAVRAAFDRVVTSAARHLEAEGAEPCVEGVLVTPMLEPPLVELLVGARRDPEVGPVLTLGAGGTWVEVLADVAHRLLPVTEEEIERMLSELRCSPLLEGARGRARANRSEVVRAALAVASCLLDNPGVTDVEVNPLFVYAEDVEAVDARVALAPGERPTHGR